MSRAFCLSVLFLSPALFARDQPQPTFWETPAAPSPIQQGADTDMVLHKITVADSQMIADVQSLNACESFRQDVDRNPKQVQVDSRDAFFIAQPIAAANQRIIVHADYALSIRGKDAAPIRTLNCFDINGVYFGKVILLATTGAVLETPGMRNAPAVHAD